MANPQPDIFLKYSKELLMAKMRTRISGIQNQVFEAVMMLTWGDTPSKKMVLWDNSTIQQMTGINKYRISEAKKYLVEKHIFVAEKRNAVAEKRNAVAEKRNGCLSDMEIVGINKNYDEWTAGVTKKRNGQIVTEKRNKVTEKRNKKETTPIIAFKKEKKKKINNKRSSEFHDHFWPNYPVKKSKQKALALWESLSQKGVLPPIEKILSSIQSQKDEKAALCKAGAFCPEWKHPTTWLYQGCWDDEPIEIQGGGDRKPWHI